MAFLFSQPQQENGTFQSADEKEPFLSHCWSYEANRPGLKWTHFDILATGQFDIHCKIKEILLTRELKPALNENVGIYIFPADFTSLFIVNYFFIVRHPWLLSLFGMSLRV